MEGTASSGSLGWGGQGQEHPAVQRGLGWDQKDQVRLGTRETRHGAPAGATSCYPSPGRSQIKVRAVGSVPIQLGTRSEFTCETTAGDIHEQKQQEPEKALAQQTELLTAQAAPS